MNFIFIAVLVFLLAFDGARPFKLKPRWTRLDLDGLIMVI